MTFQDLEKQQLAVCARLGANASPPSNDATLGFSVKTEGLWPINGLRHPPEKHTCGWYIWFGEEFGAEPDFFVPLHAYHLVERCPQVVRFLALPPGYRFLLAPDHEDVWYDKSLLHI